MLRAAHFPRNAPIGSRSASRVWLLMRGLLAASAWLLMFAVPVHAAVEVPATIRVALSGSASVYEIVPSQEAEVIVGSTSYDAKVGDRILLSFHMYGLRPHGPDASSMARDAGLRTSDEMAELSTGPYADVGSAVRHRRLIHALYDLPTSLTVLAPAAYVGAVRLPAMPVELRMEPSVPDAISMVNGRRYRGTLDVFVESTGMRIVNTLQFEDYVASVVGSEMPTSWEIEALKAQAVAARTYATRRLASDPALAICDSEDCQAYDGVDAETEQTRAAAYETAGVVATFNGDLIDAVYSANAGDMTADAALVWGDSVPYLTEVASPGDREALSVDWGASGYRWTRVFSLHELTFFRTFATAGIGDVQEARVTEISPGGRPVRMEVTGSAGQLELFGDQIRTAFGLPSAFVEVVLEPPGEEHLVSPTTRMIADLASEGYAVLRRRRSIAFDALPAEARLINGAVTIVTVEQPARLLFEGRGFGHGVGMSQWGAQGMARVGATYDQILRHFYPGIALTPVG